MEKVKDNRLGQRIRSLRLEQGLTGTELARRCGVTKGLISQIERNITAPSLAVLARIAGVLEVSMGQLLDTSENPSGQPISRVAGLPYNPIVRKNKRTVITIPKLHQAYERLTPFPPGQIKLGILKINPSPSDESLTYTHPGEACLLVLEGSITIYLEETAYHLETGDSITYPTTIPHRYECLGPQPAVLIMAETPPSFLNLEEPS